MTSPVMRLLLAVALALSLLGTDRAQGAQPRVLVVVGAQPGRTAAAERLVARLGGDVERRLAVVHGFTARVPRTAIARLRRSTAIRVVARDVAMHLSSADPEALTPADAPPAIDPPPTVIPTDQPADEVAHDVIEDAADDAAAGSSLAPDPVATGEDAAPAGQEAIEEPTEPVEPTPPDGPARARTSMQEIRGGAGIAGSDLTGARVDVALIDFGVLGIAALDGPGKLVRGGGSCWS